MSESHKDILTESEAAKALDVTVAVLQRWRRKGHGPKYIKYGTSQQARVRYQLSDIEAFKAECTVEPKEAANATA